MEDIETTIREEEFYLSIRKGQFDALKDGLPKLGDNPIRRMAAFWLGSHDAMIKPIDRLRNSLQKAMGNAKKAVQILDRLPKRSCDLLQYIRSEGGYLTVEELRSGFPLDDTEELPSLLRPLIQHGLVWRCGSSPRPDASDRLFLLETCRDILQLPSYIEGKYGSVLPKRTKEQHYNLVRSLGGDVRKLARSRQVIPWLKREMRNPTHLRRLFDSFSLSERKLLKILALHPDGLTSEQLTFEFSLFINKDPEGQLTESLKRLRDDFGIIDAKTMEVEERRKTSHQFLYRLPKEMAHIIRSNFREKYRDRLPTIPVFRPPDEDFALSARGKERLTLWIDFQQLLNHLIRCEVGVIRKGGMHKKNLKRILDRLEGHPTDAYHYLDFLFLYAYQRQILYPEGERWKINIEQLRPIQNEEAFYRDFWRFYRGNGSWNDRDSSPLQGVLQKGDQPQIFALRRALLRQLWDCPVGQWVEMKVFFDQLCDREIAFQLGEPPVLTLDPMREKYRFMKSTLERSLSWIGLVDTTTIPTQRIDLFRLTEIGVVLIGSQPDLTPFERREEIGALSIQPNLEILVPVGFPLEKQLHLARFTDDQKGRIILNRASIRRGLEDGLSVTEMHDYLNEHVHGYIPPNAEHLLEEVAEKAGHILVGGEPVRLEVSSQMLLDELLTKEQFHPFIQERASEKKALLRRGADLHKLMEELRRAGYTPRPL